MADQGMLDQRVKLPVLVLLIVFAMKTTSTQHLPVNVRQILFRNNPVFSFYLHFPATKSDLFNRLQPYQLNEIVLSVPNSGSYVSKITVCFSPGIKRSPTPRPALLHHLPSFLIYPTSPLHAQANKTSMMKISHLLVTRFWRKPRRYLLKPPVINKCDESSKSSKSCPSPPPDNRLILL